MLRVLSVLFRSNFCVLSAFVQGSCVGKSLFIETLKKINPLCAGCDELGKKAAIEHAASEAELAARCEAANQ